MIFFYLRETIIDLFKDYFLLCEAEYSTKSRGVLEIFTPKQIIQILPIALAQVKVRNTSKKLRNEISQIIYSLY